MDWGTSWVEMAGERRRVKLFVMLSRYSGKPFVRAYPWERQEMFFDAHMRAFVLSELTRQGTAEVYLEVLRRVA